MSTRRGPRPVADRVRRLLVILPWLMEQRRSTLAEMSARFEVSEAELVRDLEQVAMCGLPPYLDEMIDLFIDDDGAVEVGVPRFFTSPLRLTAPEAFELLAASRVAMALPGADPAGPLGRALRKLEEHLGAGTLAIDVSQPPAVADLVDAAATCERMAITYRSATSDEASERTIVPRLVFTDRGQWYVVADDDRSGEERRFRADRIEAWRRTGETVAARHVDPPDTERWFADDADLPVARLRLRPAGRWVVEMLPVRSSTVDGDDVVVELVVTTERWLEELLLRLGPHAVVESPAAWRDLGARAARRLLAQRYAATR